MKHRDVSNNNYGQSNLAQNNRGIGMAAIPKRREMERERERDSFVVRTAISNELVRLYAPTTMLPFK